MYTMKNEGEDVRKKFVESLTELANEIYKVLGDSKPMDMTDEEIKKHNRAKKCFICKEIFDDKFKKVREYDHITGEYRGAACNGCNLLLRVPPFIPILIHNLQGYDAHLFVKSLGLREGNIKCIPKTDEKYISFSKKVSVDTFRNKDGKECKVCVELRFLDSFKFTLASLSALVDNLCDSQFLTLGREMGHWGAERLALLRRKGVFPYDYMTGFDKLGATSLPPKSVFYNKLSDEHISHEDYLEQQPEDLLWLNQIDTRVW